MYSAKFSSSFSPEEWSPMHVIRQVATLLDESTSPSLHLPIYKFNLNNVLTSFIIFFFVFSYLLSYHIWYKCFSSACSVSYPVSSRHSLSRSHSKDIKYSFTVKSELFEHHFQPSVCKGVAQLVHRCFSNGPGNSPNSYTSSLSFFSSITPERCHL